MLLKERIWKSKFMKGWLVLFTLLFAPLVWSQIAREKVIQGQVLTDSLSLSRIEVVNVSNAKTTFTDQKGEFSILAKANDLLLLYRSSLEIKRVVVTAQQLLSGGIVIEMIPKAIALDEVVVTKNPLEGTRLYPGQKTYTPAQRKLYTARSGLLDRPLNWLSGRTKMLKKGVIVERKQNDLYKVSLLYEDKYYTNTLKIPQEYISDFQHYLIEDVEFLAALKAKNRTLMLFLSSKLAVSYNQIEK
jgi:hypothetical protein